MRFERKFRIENMELGHVLLHLKIHPASFYRLYQDRTINNIYFDTPNMACAHDNLDGNNIRKKYRIRWYGKDQHTLTKPILEVKYKENLLGGLSLQQSMRQVQTTMFKRGINKCLIGSFWQ